MATISTKYEKGQKVFFLKDNKVTSDVVEFAVISIGRWKHGSNEFVDTIEYALKEQHKERYNPILHKENEVFASIDDLANSIRQQAEN